MPTRHDKSRDESRDEADYGPSDQAREDDALLRFVERFALVLTESGMPRMPARVFSYVLAEDAERYTAAELAHGLRVSLAAISGAVRYLVQVGLLAKEREPGARSDTYRIYDDDIWGVITMRRTAILSTYEEAAADAVGLLKPDSPGARRMRETQEFYAFLRRDIPYTVRRWQEHRRTLFGPAEPADST